MNSAQDEYSCSPLFPVELAELKSEGRIPEDRKKAEIRIRLPKPMIVNRRRLRSSRQTADSAMNCPGKTPVNAGDARHPLGLIFRNSGFGFHSGFGFRGFGFVKVIPLQTAKNEFVPSHRLTHPPFRHAHGLAASEAQTSSSSLRANTWWSA